jgi:nitroimidazol reductase NimA-like FMN-containing flavoprotein (pyridoxamine 5'-phosphate oxidase superfamily)
MDALTERECWDLLRARNVGRIGFDRGRGLRIHPVHYRVSDGHLSVTTSRDSELGMFSQMFADGALVSLEVDQLEDEAAERWSVLVNARVEAVDGDEAADTGDTPPDAPRPPAGHDELTLLLTPVEITGRRRTDGAG